MLSYFALLTALSAAAVAQNGPSSASSPVPRAEFLKTMDSEFNKMDADKDKVLTTMEIEQFQRAISVVQAQTRNRALFAELDADRSGQVSAAEFMKLEVPMPSVSAVPILSQTDLNKDRSVTLVEYRTAKLANFDRMDSDKDGVVSISEMKAAGILK